MLTNSNMTNKQEEFLSFSQYFELLGFGSISMSSKQLIMLLSMARDTFEIPQKEYTRVCFRVLDSDKKPTGISAKFKKLEGSKDCFIYAASLLGIDKETAVDKYLEIQNEDKP